MKERIRFWAEQAKWPVDTTHCVFLARSVHIVGAALFPDEWTGNEPLTPDPYDLHWTFAGVQLPLPLGSARPWQRQIVHGLIIQYRHDLGRPPTQWGQYGPPELAFTSEEWDAGLEIANRLDAEHAEARMRFMNTKAEVTNGLRTGQLQSVLRPKAGGSFGRPLSPDLWNTERVEERFFWCQMNPSSPFGNAVGGDSFQYIFVGREGLEQYVRERHPKPDRSPKQTYPLKDLILWATNLFDAVESGERGRPTQDQFEKEIREQFPGVSIPYVRDNVWLQRPHTWPRKAARGA
ncbi:hypothetical protein [Mesorhizobium sp. L-8-3]|uniref:hypothetical protein n=1 Tax=Mesorhizobium sp. L-8-3 TaxID=2744522 RepID=UPI00192896F5|nr:hypothetical protein [Mesorhizobium sp. L-8-3]